MNVGSIPEYHCLQEATPTNPAHMHKEAYSVCLHDPYTLWEQVLVTRFAPYLGI